MIFFVILLLGSTEQTCTRPKFKSPKLENLPSFECGQGSQELQPWSVTLRINNGVLCGGSILHANWIITSADCGTMFKEHWGSVSLERIESGLVLDLLREQCVADIYIFPNYRPENRKHNIALLKLDSTNIQPTALRNTVCLPEVPSDDHKGMLDPKMNCVITSWRPSTDMVTLFEPHYKVATPHRRSRCKAFKEENMICTDGKGFGYCKGSNGASLTCESGNGTWSIYGIGGMVLNNTCEKGQSVSEFSDIARKSDWIKAITLEDNTPTINDIYSEWSEWTECDKFCDAGFKQRQRDCLIQDYCDELQTEQAVCNTFKCSTLLGWRADRGFSAPTKCFHTYEDEDVNFMRVVGGEKAPAEEWPFISVFYEAKHGWDSRFCGGSLINENWVLTAAHCFMDPYSKKVYNFKKYAVAFGVFEKSDFPGESRRIKSVVCHPEFKATYQQIQNDICLIRLSEPVTFNSRIKPVCVATEAPEETEYCKIAGVGQTMGTISDENLNQAALPVANFDECASDYLTFGIKLDPSQHLCAGFSHGGVDACQGDSGGPFVCNNLELSGVVSFGIGCAAADTYGIYTSLAFYVDWIASEVGCPIGYSGSNCEEDLDECIAGLHNCDAGSLCKNLVGSFECIKSVCTTGFEMVNNTCVDIDECQMNMCHLTMCQNLPGSFKCYCDTGFDMVGSKCEDRDECASDPNQCPMDATCFNNPGSFSCRCKEGLTVVNGVCSDPDPCSRCSENSYCLEDKCFCLPGWTGDGVICDRMQAQNSSCQSNKCSPDADCIVINNETICLCPTHLIGNGHECYPGPSDSTVPVNSDATLTSMVETAMLALLQQEPVQQVRQLQPDIRPLHEQLDNVCQKEPAGFDKGHVDCDYDEGVCKLTCNDGYKLALCKANGVSKCNCKGASCFWTTLGRNCRCKSTTVQTPSRFIEQGICNIEHTKNKCKNTDYKEFLEGESCGNGCVNGKQFNCLCNCKGKKCKWKCTKSRCTEIFDL